ncbi:hypothetical protein BDU57DRAFT_443604 [Ampelomyces quisqualis]|uniref:DUF7820 domain-containing protein n=1 Tax=Ampelomyces quisqualis TaxID=50730 RepID=A0A6A5QXT8_AMPQU|nr:hypothetical protein BDU57DRAFT_443604 [Ampelomyces quisqualis]
MNLPRRSVRSIQPLPSIYTAFPINNEDSSTSEHSGKCLLRQIEDGIEVVPLERSNILSAPILSPDEAEKELFITSEEEVSLSDKPLPRLPKSPWERLSLNQRIFAIIGVQLALLLVVGLSLLAVRNPASATDIKARTETTGDNSSTTLDMSTILRGPFTVPIQLPQQQSSACVARTNESVAWQCASDINFQLNILPSPIDSNATMVTLGSIPSTNGTLYHGHQAPDVPPVELKLVPSADDAPVYQFRTTYNRVVLLKENDLTSAEKPRPQPIMRHPTFQPGESVWRCVFNETLMGGYMYPNQKTAASSGFNGTAATVKDLPKIPYVLKLVEQRVPNGKGPYCEKVKVQEGALSELSGGKIMLDLADPAAEAAAKKADLVRSTKFWSRQQASNSNYCQCQWIVQ